MLSQTTPFQDVLETRKSSSKQTKSQKGSKKEASRTLKGLCLCSKTTTTTKRILMECFCDNFSEAEEKRMNATTSTLV
jgi:hypothetical protein